MIESPQQTRRTEIPMLKVVYLLAVTAMVFMTPAFSTTRFVAWVIIAAALAVQLVILVACRVGPAEMVRPVWRLKWLFVFLIAVHGLLPADNAADELVDWPLFHGWTIRINLTGLARAALMCVQIITVLLCSAVVRLTGDGNDLVAGLHAFRLPPLFVHSLDQTLDLLSGMRGSGERGGGGRPRQSGGGKRTPHRGFLAVLKRLIRGDVGALVEAVQANVRLATERMTRQGHALDRRAAHDVAVVTGIALCMASLKIVKILPGIPFASGHKGLLMIPLYILASRLTYSRWGGTAAGTIMGVIGFLQGDGRFGILEVLKHIVPGIIIDAAEPVMRRLPQNALAYCMLGTVAAAGRTATEFLVVLFLGARAEVFLFPAAKLVPNLLAGFLSGFVTSFLLRAFREVSPEAQASGAPNGTGSRDLPPDSTNAGVGLVLPDRDGAEGRSVEADGFDQRVNRSVAGKLQSSRGLAGQSGQIGGAPQSRRRSDGRPSGGTDFDDDAA
jgi:hypothetical protein